MLSFQNWEKLGRRGWTLDNIEVCILRAGGTNCDVETKEAFDVFEDVSAEVVRVNQFDDADEILDYDCLVIPGGFSFGDHIRAGTVLANELKTDLGEDLKKFVEGGGYILGICNGFQVLVELGLLPGVEGISEVPKASLAINESAKYECRWVNLKKDAGDNCVFTKNIDQDQFYIPVAHKEGRFILEDGEEGELFEKLVENDQIVLRYCDEDGEYADGEYPANPNGALKDIAGICDPSGRIFGLMPHPERAYYTLQLPDWTSKDEDQKYSDGRLIFESLIDEIRA